MVGVVVVVVVVVVDVVGDVVVVVLVVVVLATVVVAPTARTSIALDVPTKSAVPAKHSAAIRPSIVRMGSNASRLSTWCRGTEHNLTTELVGNEHRTSEH